jgi:LPXTG-motif cell wall-anchored protein
VTAGDDLDISGAGWDPDTHVDLVLHSNPVDLGSESVASDGTFATTITIPSETAAGTHTIEVSGTEGGAAVTKTVQLTVVSASGSQSTTGGTSNSSGSGGGSLPRTGGSPIPLVLIGVALLAGGGVLVRRRARV